VLSTLADRLTHLPREARDTLFLLAVIAWVVLLQLGHIPVWCAALAFGILLWRTVLTWRGAPLPGWIPRLALLALTLGATWITHSTILGRDAGVTLIVVLLALKTLEMRARRDAFVIFFLAFFTLLTHFFYSQSLLTAMGILVALLGLLTALVNAHMPVGRPPLRRSAGIAAGMAALGLPVMVVLFMLFPRMAPLWGVPGEDPRGRSGLSEEMRVGEIAELVLNDEIAFRIRFDGKVPPPGAMYFRGPVLGDFDGVRWRPQRSGFPPDLALPVDLELEGEPVGYEVTLEPQRRPWLFLLEAASEAPDLPALKPRMTRELQWLTQQPVNELLRYRAQSHVEFRHGPREAVLGLQDYLELPPGFNPRTLALAQDIRRVHGAGPDAAPAAVAAVIERLRTGGYSYTLEPGVYGQHAADEFWFDRREGFCEHIASSFVILMRAMDIPARVVTGYQGGEINAVDGYWVVRQRDAHAWAEVWLRGQGWVRVDPTAAVAQWRIGSLDRLRPPPGALAGLVDALDPTLMVQMRAVWEAVNNSWNQWVLNYTQGRQLDLLQRLGWTSPTWTDLLYALLVVLVLASLAGAAWQLWERQQHDPWLRLLDRARRRLLRHGLPDAGHLPPRALADRARRHFGDGPFSAAMTQWLLRLESWRYGREPVEPLATLREEFKRLPWPPKEHR
jgi:transglutaminase-like putative cysteine protease